MKASHALSQPVVPEGSAAVLDLLISFSLAIDRLRSNVAGVP